MSFYTTELEEVLRENSYGIREYSITPDRLAHIVLLEGNTIVVSLTPAGYQVCICVPTKTAVERAFRSWETPQCSNQLKASSM